MLLQWLRQLPVREADDFLPGHNLCANHVQCDQYGIGKLCEIKHTVHSVCSVVMFTLNKRGMSATMEQRHWKAQMRTIPTVTTFCTEDWALFHRQCNCEKIASKIIDKRVSLLLQGMCVCMCLLGGSSVRVRAICEARILGA